MEFSKRGGGLQQCAPVSVVLGGVCQLAKARVAYHCALLPQLCLPPTLCGLVDCNDKSLQSPIEVVRWVPVELVRQ